MKPHEEDWRLGDGVVFVSDPESPAFLFLTSQDNQDRARLAAQAPAMARLLLSLAYDTEDGCCHRCDAHPTQPHHTNCSIGSVLRAAGVVE